MNSTDHHDVIAVPIKEAARLIGVSTKTIRRRIDEGILPAYDIGQGSRRQYLIKPADLEKMLGTPIRTADPRPTRLHAA